MSDILLKYPSRNRPNLFKETFSKWRDMLSGKYSVEWLVSLDYNDKYMNTDDIHDFLDAQKNVTYCYGTNKGKVSAINANMNCIGDWDILIVVSDDMIPEIQGYDEFIMDKMKEQYPDLDGALHFNDGRTSLCTLSIMGKKLYDQFGYIYHPQYHSLWCDNEFFEVCHQWNKMTYIDQIIIRHAWIDATGADRLHHQNQRFHHIDQKVFEARKAAGFPKNNVKIKER